jgi:ABC-2 type transport system ATP-binding protein
VSGFKKAGIATLLTTQYLEEADALSDRIIVIDHGTVIAEGTADELKERTGATYCEIVPRHLQDLPAMAEALGSLLPRKKGAALTTLSDRIAMPAPDGPKNLVEALSLLNAANIELTDIALRRPSLDEVFLTLTGENTDDTPTTPLEVIEFGPTSGGRHRLERDGDTPTTSLDVETPGRASGGRHRLERIADRSTAHVRADVLP